jgi:hypothetical protein
MMADCQPSNWTVAFECVWSIWTPSLHRCRPRRCNRDGRHDTRGQSQSRRNADAKKVRLAAMALHGAEQARLSAKLTKVETFAADTRGNENMRMVAVSAAEKLQRQIKDLPPSPYAPPELPRTAAEWGAAKAAAKARGRS